MFGRVVNADTEMARTLVDNQRTGLEGSDGLRIVVIEILQRHEVTQQTIEITVNEQQLTQWHIYRFGSSQGISVCGLGSRFGCFPLRYLRTHLDEFLLRHTGFNGLFGNNSQAEFLQFLHLKVSRIFSALLLVRSYHICLERGSRNSLLFYRHSVYRRLHSRKAYFTIRLQFLCDSLDCFVGDVIHRYTVALLKQCLCILE